MTAQIKSLEQRLEISLKSAGANSVKNVKILGTFIHVEYSNAKDCNKIVESLAFMKPVKVSHFSPRQRMTDSKLYKVCAQI